MQLPRTGAANDAMDDLVSFAYAWLCYPYCTTDDLDWDYNSDEQINFFDWVAADMNDFTGAFKTNGRYVFADFKNSVIGVTDANGAVVEISYDAWGTPSYTGNINGLSILWNGYYYDSETDNYYLRNRYYSSLERRFITDDPRGTVPDENWNNPFVVQSQYDDGYSLLAYCQHDPINNKDPWGLLSSFGCPGCSTSILDPEPSQGRTGGWGWVRAASHYLRRSGDDVEFSHESEFARVLANNDGINPTWKPLTERILEDAKYAAKRLPISKCGPQVLIGVSEEGYNYSNTRDLAWTINTGNNDAWSSLRYRAGCCIQRTGCKKGRVACRVRFDLRDRYTFDAEYDPPIARTAGVRFWHIVHFDKEYEEEFEFELP
ncbi:MAG: RHS repeat-associated core domain-containing protein [Anaerohalosphaeraceae bacterium]|nr:RHS repeat-associated core domain-containing protein [Anaerohalosphaeraceae bacterium]